MNQEVRGWFGAIYNKLTRYQAEVAAVFSTYRKEMEAAKERSKAYKDEQAALTTEREKFAFPAKQAIAEADKAISGDLAYYTGKLKEALSDYICERPSAAFINTLRVYSDFGIAMSLAEIKGLMEQADGNYTALRALGSVAAKSGFRVAVPTVEAYQKDIEEIEYWERTPILYAPMDYLHEAVELWPRVPIFGKDGAIHGEQPNSSVSLLTNSAVFSELVKSIKDTKERWGTAFIPEISAFEPVKNEDGETITPEQQREDAVAQGAAQIVVEQEDKAISPAREMGQQRANDRANAIEGIKRFAIM